jgi:hypothetical protein
MSKITFRADDDLIDRLEGFEASKSEIMREALRAYLDDRSDTPTDSSEPVVDTDSIDSLIADRVDELINDRLDTVQSTQQPQDINVNISLERENQSVSQNQKGKRTSSDTPAHGREYRNTENSKDKDAGPAEQTTCAQCGDSLSGSHVYCPNCGEKASHRVFCDCGDELRSDWGFCPSCGRRTPAADVLDQTKSGANRE